MSNCYVLLSSKEEYEGLEEDRLIPGQLHSDLVYGGISIPDVPTVQSL